MLLYGPASYKLFGFIPGYFISLIIAVIGIGAFAYIIVRRIAPLMRSAPDHRTDNIPERIKKVLVLWLAQYRQPRYMLAGVLHIVIFAGFLVLSIRTLALVFVGFADGFEIPGFGGALGQTYYFFKDYAATLVLIACVIAAIRRGIFKPARYAVPEKYGHDHTAEAVFVLGIIGLFIYNSTCGGCVFDSFGNHITVSKQKLAGSRLVSIHIVS